LTTPLANAFSRRVEREADAYALDTSDPAAFVSAMRRLADQNLAEYRPERWVEVLFYGHPALFRRVEMGEERLRQGEGVR
jgi:STE24 endopeptidase